MHNIQRLIEIGITQQASDLHLSSDCLPMYRVDGILCTFHSTKFDYPTVQTLIESTMNTAQKKFFLEKNNLDYAFETMQRWRVRANAFWQHRGASAAFRFISSHIQTFDELKLPIVLEKCCHFSDGLVLIAGATGSGKSTTLSTLIEHINMNQRKHIITIEDPIEFIYENKLSLIQQREVKNHIEQSQDALRMALRQDPDVIILGEMRDKETISLALQAAETGHLVFSTLHASSTTKAIERIIQHFPSDEQHFVRMRLANTLRMILTQALVMKKEGGRTAISEVMFVNAAISNLIRENKLMQISSVIQTNRTIGMQTREQHQEELERSGVI